MKMPQVKRHVPMAAPFAGNQRQLRGEVGLGTNGQV